MCLCVCLHVCACVCMCVCVCVCVVCVIMGGAAGEWEIVHDTLLEKVSVRTHCEIDYYRIQVSSTADISNIFLL